MPETIGTAYIQIEPTTKGIQGSLSNVLEPEATKAGTSAGNKLSSALGGAMKVGVASIAAATAAVGAFGKASVEAGMQFDSSMSQVAATMGFSTEELNTAGSEAQKTFQQLSSFAQEMGAKTAFSASEAADALNYMALAAYDADTSMATLPSVLNLAAAGGIDLASASDMVTDALSAFGKDSSYATTMVDQMAKTASKSNTSVSQLGEAFLTIGGTAKDLKGGTAELSMMLGKLADSGIKGAEAGTHLRNIMLAMNPTTDKAKAAWEDLQMSAYDTDGALKPLNTTFVKLNEKLSTMTDQERTDILTKMFNKTDLSSVNALLSVTMEQYSELGIAIAKSKDAASAMADTQLDNLAGDITLLQSAFEGVKIQVSNSLTPALRDFVQITSEGFGEIAASLQNGDISGAFDAMGDTLSNLVNKVVEVLPEMTDAGIKLLESLIDGLISNLPQIVDSAVKIVMSLADAILNNLPKIVEAALKIIVQLAQGLIKALPELIPKVVEVVLTITETLIDNVDLIIDGAIALIIGLAEGLINALPLLIEKTPEIVAKLCDALIRNAPKLLQASIKLILTLQEGIMDSIPKLLEAVPKIIQSLKDYFIDGAKAMISVGEDLVDGIKQGIKNQWERLKDWLGSLCGGLVDTVKNALRIGSPSKVFRDEVGQWIPEGIAVGIDANADSVTDAIDGLTSDAVISANAISKNATFTPSYGTETSTDSINFEEIVENIGSRIESALQSVGIYMDGRAVGNLVAVPVNEALGRINVRRE